MTRRPCALGALLGLAVSAAGGAAAAGPEQDALAEQLFEDARRLAAQQRFAEACDKFAESQRLAPAAGTLANLAVCHETIGKTASAWAELKEVEAEDRATGTTSRRALVAQHLAALEPRLSRIVVRFAGDAAATDLAITVDGVSMGRAALGSAMPFDPGEHLVVVRAPGKRSWETRVVLGPAGDLRSVDVGPLVDVEAPAPSLAPSAVAATAAPPPAVSVAEQPSTGGDTRLLGGLLAGAGVVAIGVGSYFGLAALSDRNASDAQCNPGCTRHAVDLETSAENEATVSTVAFGVGIAALAAGTYFFFLHPAARAQSKAAQLDVAPWAGPRASGVAVRASW